MKNPTFRALLLAAPILSASSLAVSPALAAGEEALPGPDTQFLAKATISGLDEVELSRIAAQKASNPEVKQFAERMVKDHTAVNDKLKQEAARHKLNPNGNYGTPPLEPDKKAATFKQDLEGLSDGKFDQTYIDHTVQDHVKAVALFQEEATNGKDTGMRNLADTTLPTLKDHLQRAQQLADKLHQSG